MNASPGVGTPWDPAGYYELKLDTNEDYVEDITWRFTFPVDSAGTQHVEVAELTGREAADRTAKGRIITPRDAPVGEVLELDRGIKVFAGKRRDPFFNYIPFPLAVTAALAKGVFPDLAALFPPHDDFLNNSVRSVLVEAPAEITGRRRLHYWATTAVYDQGHRAWFQVQRAGAPNVTTFWNFAAGPGGHTPPERPAVRPRHQCLVGPLARVTQRQGPGRGRIRQHDKAGTQPGLRLGPQATREAAGLLPRPPPTAGKLTRHRERAVSAFAVTTSIAGGIYVSSIAAQRTRGFMTNR